MDIMHPAGPIPVAHPLAAAMARLDGCPTACGNTEAPTAATPTDDGWMARYACADCGHAWVTSWKD